MLLPADVQLPTPPHKQRQPTRGSHVIKTRSQDTPKQSGSGFENMKFKKNKLYNYLLEDTAKYITRPFCREKWTKTT